MRSIGTLFGEELLLETEDDKIFHMAVAHFDNLNAQVREYHGVKNQLSLRGISVRYGKVDMPKRGSMFSIPLLLLGIVAGSVLTLLGILAFVPDEAVPVNPNPGESKCMKWKDAPYGDLDEEAVDCVPV